MSYGSDYLALARESAVYVDKIVKGAKPPDLPVAFPTSSCSPSTSQPPGRWGSDTADDAGAGRRGDRMKRRASEQIPSPHEPARCGDGRPASRCAHEGYASATFPRRGDRMKRRDFVVGTGGHSGRAPSVLARAQQSKMPFGRFPGRPASQGPKTVPVMGQFHKGCGREAGFVEGQNLLRRNTVGLGGPLYERLPIIATELVKRLGPTPDRHHLAAGNVYGCSLPRRQRQPSRSSYSRREAIRSRAGLVASLNRPGGNITGVAFVHR